MTFRIASAWLRLIAVALVVLSPGLRAAQAPARQAVDDRVDPNAARTTAPVGQGRHFGRRETAAGAYFNDRHRDAVRAWLALTPARASSSVSWQIGHPLPRGAKPSAVPIDVAQQMPKVPPGTEYVRVGNDVLLVASGSRMVVDAIAGSR